jgi:hypothetical protein
METWFIKKGGLLLQTRLNPTLPPVSTREGLKLRGHRLQDPRLRDPNLLHQTTHRLAQRAKHLVRKERTKSCYRR